MLEIVNLTDINLKMFLDYVMSDIPRYFFFILDQKQYPEHSRFLIALNAGKIVGLCLIWKNDTVHIRGQNESIVKALFDALPQEFPIRVFNFEFKYKNLLHTLVPKPKHEVSMHRMLLKKENMIPRFQLNKPYTQKTLSKDDGLDIAKLMRKADKVFWRNVKVADLTFDDNQIYTGLYDGKKLISFTLAWVDESAAIIANAATHPKYQNQGLATFLVNECVHKMMEHTEIAIIHVVTENKPAIRVYSKVGYEIFATYELVGG